MQGEDVAFAQPEGAARCAVLVLSGSSGRVEHERVRLLAEHGAVAMSIRWFGGTGQPPGICEVPLETFAPALDQLAAEHEHLVVLGVSKGAEAALLLASTDPRIRAVAAFSPSSVVWANIGPGRDGRTTPYRSSWTRAGAPLSFVPYDERWQPAGDPPSFCELYRQSLQAFPDQARGAVIPVQHITGEVLLTAGGEDQVWPSQQFVEDIVKLRAQYGMTTTAICEPGAGHRLRLPGEAPAAGGAAMARGGSRQAAAALGRRVWPELARMLNLR